MALEFSVKNVISKGLGGMKIRLVTITFDNAYVAASGYTLAAADCKLRKIVSLSALNLAGYQIAATAYNSDGSATLKAYKGNTNSSDNEAGLNGLIGVALVMGY